MDEPDASRFVQTIHCLGDAIATATSALRHLNAAAFRFLEALRNIENKLAKQLNGSLSTSSDLHQFVALDLSLE